MQIHVLFPLIRLLKQMSFYRQCMVKGICTLSGGNGEYKSLFHFTQFFMAMSLWVFSYHAYVFFLSGSFQVYSM